MLLLQHEVQPFFRYGKMAKAVVQTNLKSVHLLYHSLSLRSSRYSYELSTHSFEKHVRLAYELNRRSDSVPLPVFTFDDGHISNYEYAVPILSTFALPAIFFITASWIESGPNYMSWQQIRTIRSLGHQIGSHTSSHPMLTHCSDSELKQEIQVSKDLLENKLGAAVESISFPGGRYNKRVLEACERAGYDRVYTSDPYSRRVGGLVLIGRTNVRNQMDNRYIYDLIKNKRSLVFKKRASFIVKEVARRLLGDQFYWKCWTHINHYSA
jgi:peptidoglycan/xylan/chitin deacetylase (PgdA/CDA1 family)